MSRVASIAMMIPHLYASHVLRRKQVYVVLGMRRSGNHAFVNWFANALERSTCELEPADDRLYVSKSKRTVHFNEVNRKGFPWFARQITSRRGMLAKAENVIVSLEDYMPLHPDPFIPRGAKKISITRSTLNLVASRIQRAVNRARLGLDRGDMRVDGKFVERLCWIQDSPSAGWYQWDYDAWLRNEADYRLQFLQQFGLSHNEMPGISSQGGGSSFIGRSGTPDYEAGANRWQQIDWPHRLLRFLDRNSDKLRMTSQEKNFLEHKLRELSEAQPEDLTNGQGNELKKGRET